MPDFSVCKIFYNKDRSRVLKLLDIPSNLIDFTVRITLSSEMTKFIFFPTYALSYSALMMFNKVLASGMHIMIECAN